MSREKRKRERRRERRTERERKSWNVMVIKSEGGKKERIKKAARQLLFEGLMHI